MAEAHPGDAVEEETVAVEGVAGVAADHNTLRQFISSQCCAHRPATIP